MEVNCELGGGIIDVCPNLKVDVHEPDIYLNVELRQKIYLYCESIAGPWRYAGRHKRTGHGCCFPAVSTVRLPVHDRKTRC